MTAAQPSAAAAADLAEAAFAHCVFPLTAADDVRRDGPAIYVHGEGVRLTDAAGRAFIDMMSAHTRANALGYGNREIAAAVGEQLATLHYIGTAANLAPPTIRLAAKIAELTPTPLSKVLFVNDGSEAVESAFKLARQYHVHTGKPRANKIISRWNAYHGATMGALSATDWLDTRHIAEPGVPGHSLIPGPSRYRNPFGMEDEAYGEFCATYLEREIQHQGPDYVAAFIAEPVMQANGVQTPPDGYFERVREICDRYGVLLIVDEVITGFGRTGAWFASDHWDIQPDLMTMAKALTAGYVPMGAVAARAEIVDALPVFRHVHTFSGHAGAAAAANTVIAIMERGALIARSRELGAYMLDALTEAVGTHPIVGQVRGIGMWLAVDFTADRATRAPFEDDTVAAVVRRMHELGVLASPIGTAFEMAPPLISEKTDLDFAVEIAARAIDEVARERHLV
ncbi:MAG: aspartate aminotransferase family protein [Thermomicrobiales bacterium]|nr:aspartate aminotransferase family protein [Thermomicrobiales bacterium]